MSSDLDLAGLASHCFIITEGTWWGFIWAN